MADPFSVDLFLENDGGGMNIYSLTTSHFVKPLYLPVAKYNRGGIAFDACGVV